MAISNTEISSYLKRVDNLLPILYEKNVISEPTRKLFFTDVLCVSEKLYKNWYGYGIRAIYKEYLSLLEDKYLYNETVIYSSEKLCKHSDT
tara:strand:+ start:43340 stop:43612 length:273 start_codon:yes stop_codon:yes gene_type:complete